MIDRPDHEKQSSVNKGKLNTSPQEKENIVHKELYIEPVSYILDDDRYTYTSLPPSKALILGLLPFVSAGVLYYSVDTEQKDVTTRVLDLANKTEQVAKRNGVNVDRVESVNAQPKKIVSSRASIDRALLEPARVSVSPEPPLVSVAYSKPLVTVGAQGFHDSASTSKQHINGRNTKNIAIKKTLTKRIALAISKPLSKPFLLPTVKQVQKKSVANISTVRLVNVASKKEIVPMGILKLNARLENKHGNSVKASYSVMQQGKRIEKKEATAKALFKLPVGQYTIQAVYQGETIRKKVLIEKAHVDQLTFVYTRKSSQQNKEKVRMVKKTKKFIGTGKIVVMAHDEQGRGNVLKTDYFVYKDGKEILYRKNSSVSDFQLPVGDYLLMAIHRHEKYKGEVFIRDMKIAVKPNSTVFPVFVFNTEGKPQKQSKVINGKDLKIPAELLLHNDGYDEYASSDYLDKMPKLGLPMGIGYVRKNL